MITFTISRMAQTNGMNCCPGCRAANAWRKEVLKYYKPETAKHEATLDCDTWQMEDKDRTMEPGTIRQEAKVENKNKDTAWNKAAV